MRRLATFLFIVSLLMANAMPAGAQPAITTDELLAGMITEEVEPGVFRVVNDGVRDLAKANDFDIVAGHDGGIWLLRRGRFFRLGSDDWLAWPTDTPKHAEFEVAPDGTVWVGAHEGLQSLDGADWTADDGHEWRTLEIAPDGTVWSTWADPEQRRQVFGYLDDGWQAVGDSGETDVYVMTLHVAGPDDIWATVPTWVFPYVVRFVDGAWQRLVGVEGTEATWQPAADPAPDGAEGFGFVALGPDGTTWLSTWDATDGDGLARFDGDEWNRWPIPDTEALRASRAEVAPDGSLWSASGFPPDGCQGVRRFDGVTWDGFLTDLCVGALDITTDGAVWLLATEPGAGLLDTYVITPRATAAAE